MGLRVRIFLLDLNLNFMVIKTYGDRLYGELLGEIDELSFKEKGLLARLEACIALCIKYLGWLRNFVKDNKPKDELGWIVLFKEIKPKFKAQLLFYKRALRLEAQRTVGDKEALVAYYIQALEKLAGSFAEDRAFWEYVRRGCTHLDTRYYVPGVYDPLLDPDENLVDADPDFSSSHDSLLAKVMANELLVGWLEKRLGQLHGKEDADIEELLEDSSYVWTESKNGLTEVGYSFHLHKCFNNGKATLNGIMGYLQMVFHVDLGNFHNAFKQMRRRAARTPFLDGLKKDVLRKMDDMDEKGDPDDAN